MWYGKPHSCREIVVRKMADKFQPPRGFCWKYLIHIQIANWNRFISFQFVNPTKVNSLSECGLKNRFQDWKFCTVGFIFATVVE